MKEPLESVLEVRSVSRRLGLEALSAWAGRASDLVLGWSLRSGDDCMCT